MKRIVVLFVIMLASVAAYSQFAQDTIIAREALKIGDSIAPSMHSGTLIDEDYFNANALTTNAPYIDFDTTQTSVTHREGRLWYNDDEKNWVMYNNRENTSMDVGREGRMRGINSTGSTITNGQVVIISGDASGIRTLALANASWDSTAIGTIGFATEDIVASDTGEVALWGEVNGLNTTGCTSGEIIWLDTIDGAYRNTIPNSPAWQVLLGNCGEVHATTGSINARIDIRTNTADVLGIFNGAILDNHTVEVTSNGTTVQAKLFETGRETVTLFFDGLPYRFSVPDSIALNAGSDASPTRNWVYIPKSTKALTVSTTSFPTNEQFVPIVDVIVQSPQSAQLNGVYKVHAWTDHMVDDVGQGHLAHLNKWIRNQNATWLSGVVPTTSIGTNAAAIDTVKFSVTSGQVLQLHSHAYPAIDVAGGDSAHVINDESVAYEKITNLGSIDTDNGGNSLRSNNTYYSLVLWGSVSEEDFDCQMFVNKPSGFYTAEQDAIDDAENYTVYTIPVEYRGTGFLIARITLRYQTADNGTFTVVQVDDLRGLLPATGAGGGAVTPSSGNFADNAFTIFNITDNTKILDFDVSGVTTGTARTLTMPDKDLTPIDSADVDNMEFEGVQMDTLKVSSNGHVLFGNATGLYIRADGATEYIHVWDASGTVSFGATNTISFSPNGVTYTFGSSDVVYPAGVIWRNSTDTLATKADARSGGGGGTASPDIVDQSILTSQDTFYMKLYKDETRLDTVAIIPSVIDTLLDNMYLATVNISSSNILSGDSILIVSAPGSNKIIIPVKVMIKYVYNTTAYTGSVISYIKTFGTGGLGGINYYNVLNYQIFNFAYDQYAVDGGNSISQEVETPISSNSPYWLQLTSSSTGDGTGILKMWYLISDYN